MRVIIAGGRQYTLTEDDWTYLATLPITIVVSGGASGADQGGEDFADANDLPIRRFHADWRVYKRAAGPRRNKQMGEYADAVVLFPGGRGTASMEREAKKAGILIYDKREIKTESTLP